MEQMFDKRIYSSISYTTVKELFAEYCLLNFEIRFIDLVIQEEIEKIKNESIVKEWLRHLDSTRLSEFAFIMETCVFSKI